MAYTARAEHLARAVEAVAGDSVAQLSDALERANQDGREEAMAVIHKVGVILGIELSKLQRKQKDFDENPTD